jgi:DNA-binding transcriptional LysR family regulator
MQLPSIENLRCFEAAAKSTSFRAAAREVGLTPAAFGQRIRQLEHQVGSRLFHRTTRSVALTEDGLALVPRAREALESVARCAGLKDQDAKVPMEINIGTRYELGLSWVVPMHDALTKHHQHLTLHYYFGGSSTELLVRLRTREIDCVVTSQRLTDPQLDSERLHREDYLFVGSPDLLEKNPFTRESHASNHTLIDINLEVPLFTYWKDAPAGGDRLRFGSIWRVGSIEPMRRLVLDGRGVAVLPQYFVGGDVEKGRLQVIFPSIQPAHDFFRLVFRRDDARRSTYTALADTMREHPLR